MEYLVCHQGSQGHNLLQVDLRGVSDTSLAGDSVVAVLSTVSSDDINVTLFVLQ